jgi:Protein of unknown function (DUF1588)/Protein of unknown function (DUF1592)
MRNLSSRCVGATLLSLVILSCGGDKGFLGLGAVDKPNAETPDASVPDLGCVSNREFLALETWNTVLEGKCQSCHGPGGVAEQQNADFLVKPSAYPGFLEANLEVLTRVSKTENEGVSILLRKALGELGHGGGAVLAKDSDEYRALSELVTRVQQPESCTDSQANHFDDVVLLDAEATFRKASLALAGRLPSPEEAQRLTSDGDAALAPLLQSLMNEEAFYARLLEIFNDQWLTDRYMRDSNGVLNDTDFPNMDTYYDGLTDELKLAARRSLAREPLELMAYIVRNNRPFTEIVTANYTVLNPFTATAYNNTEVGFAPGEYDERSLREGTIYVSRDGQMLPIPHAGILTSPIFLNRYPTSGTNRNRHRASVILRELLATDILKVADRPIDPTKSVNFANPTREDPSCKMCHVVLDPIAGAFQKWEDNDQERYQPDREWHTEMFLPGFGEESMLVTDYPDAVHWLGLRIAQDPRFPLAVVRNMYKALLGQEPADFPANPKDGSFLGWETQDATIRSIAEAFVAQNFNLKVVIEGLIQSPYFRAANTTATNPARLAQLQTLGTGRLLSPEQLNRKLQATLGYTWRSGQNPALLDAYNLLYGGIDSDSVTERLVTPNGIMSAIMWRMANEVSCRAVSLDFASPQASRRLFKEVEVTTVPETVLAEPDAAGRAAIVRNLSHLYLTLLGEPLVENSSEFDRVYNLFVTTWREGRAKLASEEVSRSLPYDCQYRRAAGTEVDLPEEQQVRLDETYVIRSWMAVTTYLLTDFRFLYD